MVMPPSRSPGVRPALEVADTLRRHGAAYRAPQAGSPTSGQRRVMAAIDACRTAALGGHVERCEDCGETRIALAHRCHELFFGVRLRTSIFASSA
jgi:hypothetical protein